MMFQLHKSVNQPVNLPPEFGIQLVVKREDQIHPFISGNKYRKLKYTIEDAQNKEYKKLLTFGGAYSNHIAAVAFAGHVFGFETLGVIRGDELKDKKDANPTLAFAKKYGMQFQFVTREVYRTHKLMQEYQDYYVIPEGGTNTLAIKGCEEILIQEDTEFDYICTSVGTGGTISGLINCSQPRQQVLGFPALKGSFLQEDISKFVSATNWKLITDYHFGGYAKTDETLIRFMNAFKQKRQIPLDPVYTGKMMFGIFDLIQKNYFPKGSKILAIHTGGLQGIEGMNNILKQKKLPLIE